jgi:hypothetical protein
MWAVLISSCVASTTEFSLSLAVTLQFSFFNIDMNKLTWSQRGCMGVRIFKEPMIKLEGAQQDYMIKLEGAQQDYQ